MAYIKLSVKGMSCVSCSSSIRSFLEEQGASNIAIDVAKESVDFNWSSSKVDSSIVDGIEGMGFKVVDDKNGEQHTPFLSFNRILLISILLTAPLILNHIFHSINGKGFINVWLQLLMSLPVYIIGLFHFGRSSYFALKNGTTNMDVLIFLGSTAAFFYSLYGFYVGEMDMIFFETAASIITLVLVGNWIEKRSLAQTSAEIDDISELLPSFVTRILPNSLFETIPLQDLMLGDRIMVREGENIAVDGKVISGSAEVNEALLTGESNALKKEKGDDVISGSLIEKGFIEVMMIRSSEDSYIQKIVELIKIGQNEKPQIQRMADKVSSWFVPIVIGISAFVFLLEYFILDFGMEASIINAIAVLVVSCPCAMGLATPTALAVGLGRLAKLGIIVKGKDAIQKVMLAGNFVFDKTGTITEGDLIIDQWCYDTKEEDYVDNLVFTMEGISNHPISKTILNYLTKKDIKKVELQNTAEMIGQGISAEDLEGNKFFLGKDPEGKHDVVLIKNYEVLLTISFKESLIDGSSEVINYLNNLGKKTILLSGDRKEKVDSLASQLGFKEVFSGMIPSEKYEKIEEFSDNGGAVMIGDGVNDAPALQRASVGVSFFNSSGIAQANADILLMKPSLSLVEKLHKGSKSIVLTIKQNLFWAFLYNVVAIPLAAMGYLSPMLAAISMAFSDLVVIGNSLLLRRKI